MAAANPTPELDARFSDPGVNPTPWEVSRQAIDDAELFWIATVRANGRPHVAPLPAVWDDEALYFCTGPDEQKGVNLARNQHCTLTTGNNAWKSGLDVVVEGIAERVTDDARLRQLADRWASKYHGDWQYDVGDGVFHHGAGTAFVFEVRPTKVIAFSKGEFAQTRYRF
jgi:general stress protein 26